MGLPGIVKDPVGTGRDYFLYPLVAAVVPGRFQPSVFRRLPGALQMPQEQPYQLEALCEYKAGNPALAPESLEQRAARKAACRYSARSGALEAYGSAGIFIANAVSLIATGTGLDPTATAIGFGVGITDGGYRFGEAAFEQTPTCLVEGVLNRVVFAFTTLKESAIYLKRTP